MIELGTQIPESLLAGKGMERLLQRVGKMPASVANACAFELRLGDAEPQADFAVFLLPGPVAQYYIDRSTATNPSSAETWIGQFLSNRPVHDKWCHSVVLAYDIIDCPPGNMHPSSPIVYLKRQPLADQSRCEAHTLEQIANTIDRIAGWNRDERERQSLAKVCQMLPSKAGIVIAAPVTGKRAQRAVRLPVAGISNSEIEGFLERVKWRGEIQSVIRLLSEVQDVADKFILVLDVTADGVLPHVGLEMCAAAYNGSNSVDLLTAWQTTTSHDWHCFVERLTNMGLCLPAKADGLLSWPRFHPVYSENGIFLLYVGINHIKLTVTKKRLQAKAYVGLALKPVAPYTFE